MPLQMTVWNNRMTANSWDRYIYLALHKFSLMGSSSRRFLNSLIKKDMTVVDVGANIGLYTGLFSYLVGPVGKVISVEPDPDNFLALLTAAETNRWANVECHACALHDKQDSLLLLRDPCNSGNHVPAYRPQIRLAENLQKIEGRRLDKLVSGQKVDFIKIDVQGWELRVLQGAQQIIASKEPLSLLVELWPKGLRRNGSSADEVLEYLRNYSFRLIDPKDGLSFKAAPTHGYKDVLAFRP